MLLQIGDIIHLKYDPKEDMDAFNCTNILKEDIVGPSQMDIGANVEKFQMQNGKEYWSMHCVDYLQGDIKNTNDILSNYHGVCLKQ